MQWYNQRPDSEIILRDEEVYVLPVQIVIVYWQLFLVYLLKKIVVLIVMDY